MGRALGAGLGVTVPAQDIYEISDVQKQRIGTRLQRGDRVFRYVKAYESLTTNQLAVHPYQPHIISSACIPTASSISYPIGSTKVVVTVGGSDGEARGGAIAAHSLEGGYAMFFKSGTLEWLVMGVLDNGVASGNLVELTLDGELPIALTHTVDYCEEVMANPYRNITDYNTGGFRPFMGVSMRMLTSAKPYGWIQTWGPTRLSPQSNVGNATTNNSQVVFRHDGSCDIVNEITDDEYANQMGQHAGFVLTRLAENAQAAPFIFLQVSP